MPFEEGQRGEERAMAHRAKKITIIKQAVMFLVFVCLILVYSSSVIMLLNDTKDTISSTFYFLFK